VAPSPTATTQLAVLGGGDIRTPAPAAPGDPGDGDRPASGGLWPGEGAVKGATAFGRAPLGAVRTVLPTAGPEVFLPMVAALLALGWFAVRLTRRRRRSG